MDGGDCELVETLRRETRLKQRLNELASTLDQVGQHSELRHQQSADLVNHLKSANTALVQTLDRSKKKYQCRLRKLEQQMLAMVERHSQQVYHNLPFLHSTASFLYCHPKIPSLVSPVLTLL